MALDLETALSQYGLVGIYARNNPEINSVLNRAIAGEWDSARFERELWNTGWWKKLSESRRLLDVQRVTDPATYQQTISNKAIEVGALFRRMGIDVAYGTATRWATEALKNGWDEATLRSVVMSKQTTNLRESGYGGLMGEAGEVEAHVTAMFAAYGMTVGEERIKQIAASVIGGQTTLGGMDNEIRAKAKALYPKFAKEFDEGKTLREIAEPYIQTMAATLEIPAEQINVDDPHVKRALQYTSPQGYTVKPLWEYEKELKSDPRWDKTKQASNETYAILQQIGSDWGFAT